MVTSARALHRGGSSTRVSSMHRRPTWSAGHVGAGASQDEASRLLPFLSRRPVAGTAGMDRAGAGASVEEAWPRRHAGLQIDRPGSETAATQAGRRGPARKRRFHHEDPGHHEHAGADLPAHRFPPRRSPAHVGARLRRAARHRRRRRHRRNGDRSRHLHGRIPQRRPTRRDPRIGRHGAAGARMPPERHGGQGRACDEREAGSPPAGRRRRAPARGIPFHERRRPAGGLAARGQQRPRRDRDPRGDQSAARGAARGASFTHALPRARASGAPGDALACR